MNLNHLLMALGIVLALAGGVFLALPHESHNEVLGAVTGHGSHEHTHEFGHDVHQLMGAASLAAGLALICAGWKLKLD